MNNAPSTEDRVLLEAFGYLGSDRPFHDLEPSKEAAAVLATFAALPYELTPVPPSPALRRRLLEAVQKDAPSQDLAPVRSFQASTVRASTVEAPTRIPGWAKALAAALITAVFGLGISASRLNESLERQREEIASLSRAMMVGHLEAEAQLASTLELASDSRFRPIQADASKLFPITAKDAGSAWGAVFVCAKHRRWYLQLSGLEPPPGTSEYKLWFLTDSGLVPVTTLDVRSGEPLELSADRMPPDTRGIFISIESDLASGASPDPRTIIAQGRDIIEI